MGSYESVKQAIIWRVTTKHVALLEDHGLDAVITAIEQVASGFENVQLDEIGTSDISCWVRDVTEILQQRAAQS